jgi:hypothetical protein
MGVVTMLNGLATVLSESEGAMAYIADSECEAICFSGFNHTKIKVGCA